MARQREAPVANPGSDRPRAVRGQARGSQAVQSDDFDSHGPGRPLHGAHGLVDVGRVQVGELQLGDFLDLSLGHLADLVLVRKSFFIFLLSYNPNSQESTEKTSDQHNINNSYS